MKTAIVKIISGGQTGVDQGALDFAMVNGIRCGGWCPKGRVCEDGRIPDRYPMSEVDSGDYNERTARNIEDAHGTLIIITDGKMDPGTRLTESLCNKFHKPVLVLDITPSPKPETTREKFELWVGQNGIRTLNVAGNRESTSPGIRKSTMKLLGMLIR